MVGTLFVENLDFGRFKAFFGISIKNHCQHTLSFLVEFLHRVQATHCLMKKLGLPR